MRRNRNSESCPPDQALDVDRLGLKKLAQRIDAFIGIRLATHENVDRRIVMFRPCMNTDMGFGEQDNPGNALVVTEIMQASIKHNGAAALSSDPQCVGDLSGIRQVLRAVKFDDQMCALCGLKGMGYLSRGTHAKVVHA